jgi:hypothetical protein
LENYVNAFDLDVNFISSLLKNYHPLSWRDSISQGEGADFKLSSFVLMSNYVYDICHSQLILGAGKLAMSTYILISTILISIFSDFFKIT